MHSIVNWEGQHLQQIICLQKKKIPLGNYIMWLDSFVTPNHHFHKGQWNEGINKCSLWLKLWLVHTKDLLYSSNFSFQLIKIKIPFTVQKAIQIHLSHYIWFWFIQRNSILHLHSTPRITLLLLQLIGHESLSNWSKYSRDRNTDKEEELNTFLLQVITRFLIEGN